MTVTRKRTLMNPGKRRRKRRLTAKQLKYFGTKRQRAALKHRKRNAGKFSIRKTKKALKKTFGYKHVSPFGRASGYRKRTRKFNSSRRKKRNVGTILTIAPLGLAGNPGKRRKRKNSMARTRKRSRRRMPAGLRRYWATHRRKRRNPSVRRHRRRSYPVVHRRRHHRRNSGTRVGRSWSTYSRRRRRNPGILSGSVGQVLGVIGGATVTKILTGFVPASFQSGFLKYISTGLVAYLQGMLVGKVSRNSSLGRDFMVGGFTYMALQVIQDMFPSLGGTLGISGMGIIGGSNYWVPQIPQMGNMGAFVPPAMLAAAQVPVASGMHGLGSMRRMGRLR